MGLRRPRDRRTQPVNLGGVRRDKPARRACEARLDHSVNLFENGLTSSTLAAAIVASHFSAVVSSAGGTRRYFGVTRIMRSSERPFAVRMARRASKALCRQSRRLRQASCRGLCEKERLAVIHDRPVAAAGFQQGNKRLRFRFRRRLAHARDRSENAPRSSLTSTWRVTPIFLAKVSMR